MRLFDIIDFISKLIGMIDRSQPPELINSHQTTQIMISSNSGQLRPHNNKNFLVVNSPIQGQSDDEILDDMQSSNEMNNKRTKLKVKKANSSTEDYVELPKIDFFKNAGEAKTRKNSRVLIDVDLIQQQLLQRPQHQRSPKQQQYQLNEQQSQNAQEESRGWNIHNIKIIPSKNNYLQEEEFQLEHRAPSKSLILKEIDQSSRHILSREKKTDEEKQAERRIFKERERRQRERNVEIVNEFLSGKASVIWLFILNQTVPESDLKEIRKIYTEHIENDYQVPICRSYQQAQKFLKLQGCFFKVVADLQSSEKLTQQCLLHKNIVAIFIYNPHKEAGINKSFELKRTSKKIKGMFFQLSEAAKQAEQEIVNEAKFIKVDNGLQKQRNRLRFPSFFVLSGHDKTEITAYRMCLYGSLKLKDEKERRDYLKEFTDLVELRYADVSKELVHLEEYRLINHFSEEEEVKSKQILKFYVRETFYYALTNSILRISRSPEEFRPCTIPFNETYHSIKYYYNKYRKESKSIKKMKTYRGSKLRNSDVQNLQIGGYIELLGFTSTSLKREQAEKFMDNDSYLLQIVVQIGSQSPKQDFYDHGYVEINKFGLANDAYKSEQQVLFNALNVFKITALDLNSAVRKITLKYGGILDLLRSKYDNLTPHERAVISSYEYCEKTFNGIEDDGDVLLLAEEHGKCIDYYQSKIQEGNKNYKIYGKIANAYLENGDLDEAYNNALKSIEQLKKSQKSNRKQAFKHYQKYQRNKDIFNMKQDIIHYNMTIDKYLKILGQDWFRQAKLLRQRGEKRFQAADFKNAQSDLKKSKQIVTQKQKSFEQRRKQINRRYMIRSFCCICSSSSRMQLEEQRQLQLLKIQSDEVDYHNRKDEIHELLLQIANILKDLFEKSGKKDAYNMNVQQARFHYGQLSKTNDTLNPVLNAKFMMMEASLIEKDTPASSEQYQILVETAIQQVKKQNKYHQNIGTYSKVLGTHRHNQFKRRVLLEPIRKQASEQNFKQNTHNYISLKNDEHPIVPETEKYNYFKDQELYQKSKNAYVQAAQNIAYNKGNEHPQYITVRNEITELQFDFCQLSKSQNVARQTSQKSIVGLHSQGARCFLLLAKICLAKGELKISFHHIQKAFQILRTALIKFDTKQYNQIFMGHPYYIDISLLKVKIFNRQLKHDLALKELKIAKKIAKIKVENMHSRTILATIYEEEAAVLLCMGETVSFEEYITRAIEIREEEMGKYNIPNAISYSNLYKHLRNLNDSEDAENYHLKAMEIFARFPSDHPSSWILHFSNGLAFFQKGQIDDAIQQFEYCMKVATKRYSSSHVGLLKIGFQYGKLLSLMEKQDRAIVMMRDTELFLEKEMKRSIGEEKIEREIDDQRYLLRKNICNELIAIFSRANAGNSLSPQNMTGLYEKKLRELQKMLVHSSAHLTRTNIVIT